MNWTEEKKAEVVRLRGLGFTPTRVAQIFGSTPDAINGIMRRHNSRVDDRSASVLSPEESEIAVRMRSDGFAFDAIARELRRDRLIVTRHLNDLGYGRLLTNWTPEMEKTVSDMWQSGSEAPEIARALGGTVTRSAVSNKITRMGLPGRVRVRYRAERKPRKPQERIVGSSEKGSWDSRLVEPWAEFSARRKAERQKMREMCDA